MRYKASLYYFHYFFSPIRFWLDLIGGYFLSSKLLQKSNDLQLTMFDIIDMTDVSFFYNKLN